MLKVAICAHNKNEYNNIKCGDLHTKYNIELVAIRAHNFDLQKLTNRRLANDRKMR